MSVFPLIWHDSREKEKFILWSVNMGFVHMAYSAGVQNCKTEIVNRQGGV